MWLPCGPCIKPRPVSLECHPVLSPILRVPFKLPLLIALLALDFFSRSWPPARYCSQVKEPIKCSQSHHLHPTIKSFFVVRIMSVSWRCVYHKSHVHKCKHWHSLATSCRLTWILSQTELRFRVAFSGRILIMKALKCWTKQWKKLPRCGQQHLPKAPSPSLSIAKVSVGLLSSTPP